MTTTQHNTTNYKEQNRHIVDEISITKDLAKNTTIGYITALNLYSQYHQLPMQELLNEADAEEEEGIRLKRRKIKQRLLNFRQHLIEQGRQPLTINTHVGKIRSTYRFYEIETPLIPNVKNMTHELIEDIPTKEHIKTVLDTTNNIGLQALILFMSSSGTSRNESLSITIQDFITATKDYHHETSIENTVKVLEKQDNIVPTFQLYRKKTRYPYITFCTPEATKKILTYLKHRINREYYKAGIRPDNNHTVNPEDKLFHFHPRVVNTSFERLNDKLGWGSKGNHRFFHTHALRKFFATELIKTDMDSMTIDFLSGRKISRTHEAYFKADPQRLKQKYMQFMPQLFISEKVNVRDVTTKELRELEHYRERERKRDEKIRAMERLLLEYTGMSEL